MSFTKKRAATVTAISKNDILLDFIKNGKKDYKNINSMFKTLMTGKLKL